jgi:hypothetical protein
MEVPARAQGRLLVGGERDPLITLTAGHKGSRLHRLTVCDVSGDAVDRPRRESRQCLKRQASPLSSLLLSSFYVCGGDVQKFRTKPFEQRIYRGRILCPLERPSTRKLESKARNRVPTRPLDVDAETGDERSFLLIKRNLVPYAMRHTWISEALAAGNPTLDVAEWAGTSVTMIEATYGHTLEDAIDRGRAKLDAFDARSGEAFGQRVGSDA